MEKNKKQTTSVRIELTILRLTVARLNQLGREVYLLEKEGVHVVVV